MNDTPSPEDMTQLWRYLYDRITDLAVNQEALRLLLDAHGVVRYDDFLRERDAARLRWTESERESLAKVADQTLRQLLEGFQGTKQ